MANPYIGYGTRRTPQSQPIPGSNQVKNNADGFAFELDKWTRLDRFLILGTEGGTYYVGQQKLTKDNADSVLNCIKEDGIRTVSQIAKISYEGRAAKNDPALFALAMCSALGDKQTRKTAFEALPEVARIGTHLFHFVAYREQFAGWGRGMREAIANWYISKTPDLLAYQVIKYQQRDGWNHRDLLRLAHPKTEDALINNIFHKIVKDEFKAGKKPALFEFVEELYIAKEQKRVVELINKCPSLTREMLPTEFLTQPLVWQALLQNMPMTAMIRNLATMTKIGLLKPMAQENNTIVERLHDQERIKKARVHPIQILAAEMTYAAGHGVRSSATWNPVSQIIDALDDAFYLSFKNVEPTGKRILIGLDISGSMDGGEISGVPGLTPRVASAVLCMAITRVESNYYIMGFTGKNSYSNTYYAAQGKLSTRLEGFVSLNISPRQRLDDIIQTISNLPLGPTDCALPMIYALKNQIPVDAFIIYTDNETWCGKIHPIQALQEYRRKMNIPAKLIVVGMVANEFSIADSNDTGMLDVVGFDTATPQMISEFIIG